ncbi:MAG: PEP-CTERM sorting domain-containing protein [Acetobacteraceae bacterium]
MLLRTSATVGLSAAALSLMAFAAQATPLPVQNLVFTQFSSPSTPPKSLFTDANPVGWTGGTGLIAIDAPGTGTDFVNGAYGVWGAGPGGSGLFPNPPPGGNFIQADGNPTFETSFNQVITGLTAGTTYSLSFWQAAGQQNGFSGATTEQWKVFFGSTGGFTVDCSSNPCTTSVSGDTTETDTALMNTPSQGVHPWELVSMNLLATAATETLSFLAWGDNGNTTNLPPTVFLAGVNSPAVPEPATLSLLGVGILGLGAAGLRRRVKRTDKV